ncbi:MAG: hypothetical protein HQK67_07120 [Desulfamplus sp.]|nr:hypothetical protein [Desulfamplus sp.]
MNLSGIQQDADADKFSITSNEIFQNIIKNASNSSKSTATSSAEIKLPSTDSSSSDGKSSTKDLNEVLKSLGVDVENKSLPADGKSSTKDLNEVLKSLGVDVENSLPADGKSSKKDLNEVLTSLGVLGKDKNNTLDDAKINVASDSSSQADANKIKLKNSFDIFNERVQDKITNLSQVQEEQNTKGASDILLGKATEAVTGDGAGKGLGTGTGSGNVMSDLINLINNGDVLTPGRKNDQNSRI